MAPRIPFFGRRQNRGSDSQRYGGQQAGYYQQQQQEDAPPQPGLLSYMPAVGDDGDSPPSGVRSVKLALKSFWEVQWSNYPHEDP
ncbi:hypothetical protein I302_106132 [Kwoniella bestiolae CBS 10118]|uniref:Uncharacterized protein n=1 Tax=Kwoniella bestiolae CBS 10118 TaxID=1296100 RepID=A0AAJ8M9S2_9TREE